MRISIPEDTIDFFDLGIRSIDNEQDFIRFGFAESQEEYQANMTHIRESKHYTALDLYKASHMMSFSNLAWLHQNTSELPTILYLRVCKGMNEDLQKCYDIFKKDISDEEKKKEAIKMRNRVMGLSFVTFGLRHFVTSTMEYDPDKEKYIFDESKTKGYLREITTTLKKISNISYLKYLMIKGEIKNYTEERTKQLFTKFSGMFEDLLEPFTTKELVKIKQSPIEQYFRDKGFDEHLCKLLRDIIEIPGFIYQTNSDKLEYRETRYKHGEEKGLFDTDKMPSMIVAKEYALLTDIRLICIFADISMLIKDEDKGLDSEFIKLITDTYTEYNELKDAVYKNVLDNEIADKFINFCETIITKLPTDYDMDKKEFLYKPYDPSLYVSFDREEEFKRNEKFLNALFDYITTDKKLAKIKDEEKYNKAVDKYFVKLMEKMDEEDNKNKEKEDLETEERDDI